MTGASHIYRLKGARVRLNFRVSKRAMNAFRALSGNTNPVHRDLGYAFRAGFDGLIVYEGLIVAKVTGLLGSYLPGHGSLCRSLALHFRAPLYVDELAQLTVMIRHTNEALGLCELSIMLHASGRCIAKGEVVTLLSHAGSHART